VPHPLKGQRTLRHEPWAEEASDLLGELANLEARDRRRDRDRDLSERSYQRSQLSERSHQRSQLSERSHQRSQLSERPHQRSQLSERSHQRSQLSERSSHKQLSERSHQRSQLSERSSSTQSRRPRTAPPSLVQPPWDGTPTVTPLSCTRLASARKGDTSGLASHRRATYAHASNKFRGGAKNKARRQERRRDFSASHLT
jgi:hypothetical protein